MSEPVQGFLAKITIDNTEITAAVEDYSLDRTKNVMQKPTMDSKPTSKAIPGSETGSLSVSGLIDQVNQAKLELAWAKETEVQFSIEVDEGATTDLVWSGFVVLGDLGVATSSTDVWRFTLSAATYDVVAVTTHAP
jgi:hypothetical protein